jgi:hypothetical protein
MSHRNKSSTVRPAKKPTNPNGILTNEETLITGPSSIFEKKWTANLAGGDKRKKVCGPLFFKKLMGVLYNPGQAPGL